MIIETGTKKQREYFQVSNVGEFERFFIIQSQEIECNPCLSLEIKEKKVE